MPQVIALGGQHGAGYDGPPGRERCAEVRGGGADGAFWPLPGGGTGFCPGIDHRQTTPAVCTMY